MRSEVGRQSEVRRAVWHIFGAFFGLLLALGSATAMAQSAAAGFPNKPVRLIIAFTAGSATDIVGRALAAKLSDAWGQQVLAENQIGRAHV